MSLSKKNTDDNVINENGFLFGMVRRCLFLVLFFMATITISCAQSVNEDTDWLIDVLKIEKGSVVAEIGAGDGRITLAVAEEVGSSGKVYSSELGADSVQYLRNVVKSAETSNITVVEGHPSQTHFPQECCDALFMRRVYHHFDDPAAMNKSIWQSLKPGGRLAIIDFAPREAESTDAEERDSDSFQHHGVARETVVEELRTAGFTLISSEQRSDRDVYVVMEKKE